MPTDEQNKFTPETAHNLGDRENAAPGDFPDIAKLFEDLEPDPNLTLEQVEKIGQTIVDIQHVIEEKSKGKNPLDDNGAEKLANMIAAQIGISPVPRLEVKSQTPQIIAFHGQKIRKWEVGFTTYSGQAKLMFVNTKGSWSIYYVRPDVMRQQQ